MSGVSRRRWFGPLVGAVAFAVTLLLVAPVVVVTDVAVRQVEMAQLVTEVEYSEAQMLAVQEEIRRVTDDFEAIPNPTDADRAELVGRLADVAAFGQEAITEAGDDLADESYLPWHTALQRAQRDYLAHNRAWQDYLERATVDPGEFTIPQDEVNDSFLVAERSLRSALPPLADRDLRQRVDAIFAEGAPDGQAA